VKYGTEKLNVDLPKNEVFNLKENLLNFNVFLNVSAILENALLIKLGFTRELP